MRGQRWRSAALIASLLVGASCATDTPPLTSATPRVTPTPLPTPCETPEPTPTKRPIPSATPAPTPATPIPTAVGPAPYWNTIPTGDKVIALTIDCGGDAAGIPKMLAALDEADAPATFFFTGRWVEHFPDEARRIAARYPMGNHTYDHPHLTTKSDGDVRDEIEAAGIAIERATGEPPVDAFRFPYGERDDRTLRIVGSYGYTAIGWTVDTIGWRGTANGGTRAKVVERVVSNLRPGAIVLMHAGAAEDGTTFDADMLPEIVTRVRAAGYRFVSIDAYL